MKKFISTILLFFFSMAILPCYCIENDCSYQLTAYRLSKNEAIDENIDRKLAREFLPVKVVIANNSSNQLDFLGKSHYTHKNKKYKTPQNTALYRKTKRHVYRRAIIWGAIGCGLLSWVFVPLSITHTQSKNSELEDSINKNNLRKHLLFENETFVTYAFLPKKHKKAKEIALKFSVNNKPIELSVPITIEEL